MKARLLQHRKLVLEDGAIIEIKIWSLPDLSEERPHGLKYSLYFGRFGVRIVGYDNEAGKGDHRHLGDTEEPYAFTSLERLIADFEADVQRSLADD